MKTSAAITILLLCFYVFVIAVNSSPSKHGATIVKQNGRTGLRAIETGPDNVAVVASTSDTPTTVTLKCSSNVVPGPPPGSRVQWIEYFSNDQSGSFISDNEVLLEHPNKARYQIIHDSETQFDLEISMVGIGDAGTYVCEDTHAAVPDVTSAQAELIVLATTPNCSTTLPDNGNVIEGHIHSTQCAVQYKGTFSPQMMWTGPGPYTEVESVSPSAVFSSIQFTVSRTMDVGFHRCVTNFADVGPLPPNSASNTPDYTYPYQAQQMFVYWGPLNMTHYPQKDAYEVDDQIGCYADSRPTATYTWFNTRTSESILGNTFPVTSDFYGISTLMRCQAQNSINGQIYSNNIFVTINVPLPTTPPTTTTPTTTTTPPPEAPCADLTGSWTATNPNAQMILYVNQSSELGQVVGTFKNDTDTFSVEMVGIADRENLGYVGLSVIWPFEDGITGHAGECHRCNGKEIIFLDSMWRSVEDNNDECGNGGTPAPHLAYQFTRTGTLRDAQKEVHNVWKPTRISTEVLGLKLK